MAAGSCSVPSVPQPGSLPGDSRNTVGTRSGTTGTGRAEARGVKAGAAIPDKRWICPVMAMVIALTRAQSILYLARPAWITLYHPGPLPSSSSGRNKPR